MFLVGFLIKEESKLHSGERSVYGWKLQTTGGYFRIQEVIGGQARQLRNSEKSPWTKSRGQQEVKGYKGNKINTN